MAAIISGSRVPISTARAAKPTGSRPAGSSAVPAGSISRVIGPDKAGCLGDNCHPGVYPALMKTVTIRDFRSRPRAVRQALSGEREAILTANGQPIALLVPVDAETIDETAAAIRRA